MINETRNILLVILSKVKKGKLEKESAIELMEIIERDINKKLEDLKYEENKLNESKEVLNYVNSMLDLKDGE